MASVIRTYYLLEKKIHYMKHPGLMQLTVEVGKCTLPPLQYHEYALTVRLNKELSASTTYKLAGDGFVDFGTKLFLRAEKALLDQTPMCSIVVSAIGQKASRLEIGRGECRVGQEGLQRVRLQLGECGTGYLQAELQFCLSVWEVKQTKNNNRIGNLKSHLSQKQSSWDQKQSQVGKNTASFNHSQEMDKKQKSNENNLKFSAIKPSRSEKILPDKSVELETSANTTNHFAKDENLNKSGDSELIINMQLKIDHLEENIHSLQVQLQLCEEKIRTVNMQYEQEKAKVGQLIAMHEQERVKVLEITKITEIEKEKNAELSHLYEQEKLRVGELEETKEQLTEMLILEEEKNNISTRHIERLNKLIQTLTTHQDSEDFNPIQEKDEIIMLNQELEKELTDKNIAINQMKVEIDQLKQKITALQTAKTKKTPIYEAQSHEKTNVVSAKVIENEKVKMEKRPSQKIFHSVTKKSEEEPAKAPRKVKEKQSDKKDARPQPALNSKKPMLPREVKSPPVGKLQNGPSKLANKGKVSKPLLKIQQKATMQSSTKKSRSSSSLTSMVSMETGTADNLMINSRNIQAEFSKQPC